MIITALWVSFCPVPLGVEFQLIYQNTPDWNPFDERFPTIRGTAQPANPDLAPRNVAVGLAPGVPENFNVPGPNADRTVQTWWATTTLKHQLTSP